MLTDKQDDQAEVLVTAKVPATKPRVRKRAAPRRKANGAKARAAKPKATKRRAKKPDAAKLAKLDEGDWHAEYLGQEPTSPLAAVLKRFGSGGASVSVHDDFFATLARRQTNLFARLEASLRGMTETRGVQAMCEECPVLGNAPARRNDGADAGLILSLLKAIAG